MTHDGVDIEVRTVGQEDVPAVLSMFSRVFGGRSLSEDYYKWQYFDHPLGGGLSCGAWHGDQLVTHIGYTPRLCRVDGRSEVVLSNHTVMADADYRGRGIYGRLVEWALSRWRQQGYPFVLTRPNRVSHRVQAKQRHFQDLQTQPCMTLRPPGGVLARAPVQPPLWCEVSGQYDREYDGLGGATLAEATYGLERTADYLRWRYSVRPGQHYYRHEERQAGRLRACVLFKMYPDGHPQVVDIVEWLCDPDDVAGARSVLVPVLEWAISNGLPVQLWQNVFDRRRFGLLESLGFGLDAPVWFLALYQLAPTQMLGPVLDFRRWYVGMGDHDVF